MARLAINEELNGIEIAFDNKPAAETLEALKAAGYRWHRAKKVWYAKQNPERLALAQSIAGGQAAPVAPAKVAKVETINLDNLGENRPANFYGADLAKAIREDLKRRGVKGVTVRARKVTWETGITVTVKATESDIVSLEEYEKRYTFAEFSADAQSYHGVFDGSRWIYAATWEAMTEDERRTAYKNSAIYYLTKSPEFNHRAARKDHHTITSAFYNKLFAVFRIANQWNWDHSDSMTDYFDIGYFLDIDIKTPDGLTVREEMTEDERTAYAAEVKAEEEARKAAFEAWQAEQEESRKRAEEAEKIRNAQRETIANGSTVEDLNEENQIYITNLRGGAGKECNLDEVRETIASGHGLAEDAQIVRRVHMTPEAFTAFCDLLLDDFDFLVGMGGTGSEDVRLEEVAHLYDLNTEQRESVKWYICNAVAICVDGKIKLVCDPQGFSYSRYTFEPSDCSEILNATQEAEKQTEESTTKPAFYFPEPVTDQAQKIEPGEKITIYQCDGWNLASAYDNAGTVASVTRGSWAQYEGVYINFTNGKRSFVRDGKKCLIYCGIKPVLPEEVTSRRINDHMREIYNIDKLLRHIYDYYKSVGSVPLLDTVQR